MRHKHLGEALVAKRSLSVQLQRCCAASVRFPSCLCKAHAETMDETYQIVRMETVREEVYAYDEDRHKTEHGREGYSGDVEEPSARSDHGAQEDP
jgi:hypothetical protein